MVFVSGAIFGTAALVVGLIFALNVGADSLDRGREKAAEKRKKFTHLDAKKWLPKPRAVQVVAAIATRSRERAASVSSSSSSAIVLAQPPQPLLRKLVVDLIEATNLPLGTSSSIDAVVRIRLGEQRTKSRTLLKCSGSAKVRFSSSSPALFLQTSSVFRSKVHLTNLVNVFLTHIKSILRLFCSRSRKKLQAFAFFSLSHTSPNSVDNLS